MLADYRRSGLVAAAAVFAVSLVFLLSAPAFAGLGNLRSATGGESRLAVSGKKTAVGVASGAMENSAMCGKCHSSCENGRSHLGLLPSAAVGSVELPLDEEGRTTCVTCHDSRRHDVNGVVDNQLRMSNLRRELCLACHREAPWVDPRIEIVSPVERAVVHDERLALIGKALRLSGADLTVRLNESEFHLQVKGEGFSTWLRLQDGVNRIEIALQERVLWKGEVFHGVSSLGSYQLTSTGHRTGNRAECVECHLKKDEMSEGGVAAAQALCFDCHDRNDQKRFVHGPLAVGDCLACHDPHGGYGEAHLRQEQALLCGNCHTARETAKAVSCNASGKGCVECHDPHQSDTRYLLKGPQYTRR